MDYNYELQIAVKNAGIDIFEADIKNELDKFNKNIGINKAINDIWEEISKENKVAIATAGISTNEILNIIHKNKENLVCIIDKYNYGYKLNGYDVIGYDEINKYDFDTILIPSLGFSKEIKNEIEKLLTDCKLVMLYDELKLRGYSLSIAFYEDSFNDKYSNINYIYLKYKETSKEKYLLSLIYNYLEIRDIYNSFKFIDTYIETFNSFKNNIIKLKEKIIFIINNMQLSYKKKNLKTNTIFMIICDALRYKDVFESDNMRNLKNKARNGIILKKAFTHVPYTTGSLLTLFTGKKYLEDGIYDRNIINEEEEFFCELKRLNYDFKYSGCRTRLFEEKYIVPNSNINCSEMMWNALCKAVSSKKNTMYCIHFMESHQPFFCGLNDKKLKKYPPFWLGKIEEPDVEEYQHNSALIYLDEQIKFFMDIIGEKSQVVLFSDHGAILQNENSFEGNNYYNEDYIHIPYIVLNTKYNYKYNYLFSHLDTKDLLINLINNKDALDGIEKRNYVEVDRDFTYAEYNLNIAKKIGQLDSGRAFKCFRTLEEKFIIFYNGEEKYYSLKDKQKLLKTTDISDRVNKKFPKWNSKKYDNTRRFYNIDI